MKDEIDKLEEALGFFAHLFSRPRSWENLQKAAGVEIDRASAYLLHVIGDRRPGYSIGELAQKLGIEAPSVTRTVQQMEQSRLIKRLPDKEDGRSFLIVATPRGLRTMNKLRQAKRQRLINLLEGWPKKERWQLAELLHKLATQTNRETDKLTRSTDDTQ